MRDGQETKLSVEKSRIQKLQVQQQNLEETYKLKVLLAQRAVCRSLGVLIGIATPQKQQLGLVLAVEKSPIEISVQKHIHIFLVCVGVCSL